MSNPVYIESLVNGQWTREGFCVPRRRGHYAYPSREAAEAMLPSLARIFDVADPATLRIVDAEPGAAVE